MIRILAVLLCLVLVGCEKKQEVAAAPVARDSQLPTASEVFHLRSECAQCGERIERENVIGANLTQDVVSHYDPKSNRCYVQLTVQNANLDGSYYSTNLYDGQTKEMLAFATRKNGKEFGSIFGGPQRMYEDVTEYIYTIMEDKDHLVKPSGISK